MDDDEEATFSQIRFELNHFENMGAQGWATRAKVKWAKEGDIPGRFFFSKLWKARHSQTIPTPADAPGTDQHVGSDRSNL